MSGSSHLRLYSLVGAMVFFYSLNYTVARFALREFPPAQLTAVRTAVAAAVLLAIWHTGPRPRLSRGDLGLLALLGVIGITLNQLLFAFGVQRTSIAHASILSATAPIMVLLIAASIRQERVTLRKLLGMLIAIAGVVVLQREASGHSVATFSGDMIILLSAAAIALYSVLGKHVTARCDVVTLNAISFFAAFLSLTPWLWPPRGFSYGAVSTGGWLSLLYMAIFPSVISYLIYCYALTHMPASRVSAFAYLQPPLATLLAVPLLGEPVTASLASGGALVLAGVYVTERG
ncbi:MAG TPA: DMT family transporter [Bryobacteraceae bacterium]|nr:DMT family transporter [Bryobacteraceae bacterium]